MSTTLSKSEAAFQQAGMSALLAMADGVNPAVDAMAQLLTRVVVTPNGCWEWTGPLSRRHVKGGNRGSIGVSRLTTLVHRLAYRMLVGVIPHGMNVCHHCDNPPCVNPEHLYVGTQKDNMRDVSLRLRRFDASTRTHCKRAIHAWPEFMRFNREGTPICYGCHKEAERQRREQARAGLLKPAPHGTLRSYVLFKCRCVECKAANSRRNRAFREKHGLPTRPAQQLAELIRANAEAKR